MIDTINIKYKQNNTKRSIYIFTALIIAYLLISPKDITWARDRFNYLIYANSSWNMLQNNLNIGLLRFLVNEPLFLLINSGLSLFFSPEITVKIIIFMATILTLYSLGTLSRFNFWILFLFLFTPTILLKYTVHLRQGLAMSFYFVGLVGYQENKKIKYLRFLAPLIHTSIAFVLLFEFLEMIFNKIKFSSGLRLFLSSIFLTFAMVMLPGIALMLGDRRAEVYSFEFGFSGSGIGLFIWILAGSYFLGFSKKNYISTISDYGIVFYWISYFYLDFGARIFESIFPLILLSILIDDKVWFKLSYIAFLILYSTFFWYGGAITSFI